MKTFTKITTLTFSVLALSTTTFAASQIPGAGGVVIDLTTIDLSPVASSTATGVVVPIPDTFADKAETSNAKVQGLPVRLVEAAAEEPTGDAAFKAIVKAMTPRKPVHPLNGKRLSLYLSEKVAVAKYETDAKRFKVENGRVHVSTLYSEKRDSVLHTGLAVDSSLVESFRLSFGTRAYIAQLSTENTDAFAAAFGIEAAYNLPFKTLPLEFAASVYYAPDILTFGTSDRAIDAQIDFAFPLRERSSLFAGARFLQVDTRPEDSEIDNRVHMGVRWDFL